MIYTCDKCFKTFNKKSNYNYHIKRKIPCKPKIINNIDLDNKNNIVINETESICNPMSSICNPTSSDDNMLNNSVILSNKNNYICLLCNKKFKFRQGLYKHKKTHNNNEEIKNINKNISKNIYDIDENTNIIHPNNSKMDQIDSKMELNCNPIINNGNECLICHKIYSNKSSFNKHKKNKHLDYDEELQKISIDNKNNEDIILLKNKLEITEKNIEELKQTNEEYKNIIQTSKFKKLKKSEIIKNTNTTNNNNTTNNTQNNVTVNNNNYIVNFGEEDLTKLTVDDKREILCSGKQIYPMLISKIYLNENIPENNCIRITNLRSDDMFIMEDGAFVSVNKKKTMEDLLSNMSIFAKRTFEEIIKSKEEIEQDMNHINETQMNNLSVSENYGLVEMNNKEKENNLNISENYELVKVINTHGTQKQIKRRYKKPEIMLSEGQKESIKEQIMFIFRYDTTGEDEDAEDVIKCTPTNLKRYTQIKKDSEIKIYNFRNKINKNLIKN